MSIRTLQSILDKNNPVDVVTYMRASKDHQETSCDDQSTLIDAHRKSKKMRLDTAFSDDGVQGWKKAEDREGFDRAIEYVCRPKTPKLIVVWKQNRFSRLKPRVLNRYLDRLCEAGAYIYTLDKGIIDPDNLTDRITTDVQAHQDAEYSSSLSDDVHSRMAILVEQGYWVSSPPFGYSTSGPFIAPGTTGEKGYKLIPCEKEAEIVKHIFSMSAKGKSSLAIAKYLNDSGVPTISQQRGYRKKKGVTKGTQGEFLSTKWCDGGVSQILRSNTYLGHTSWGYRKSGYAALEKSDRIKIVNKENTHEPLITKDMRRRSDEAIAARKRNTRLQDRESDEGNVLGGLLVCGNCNRGVMHKDRSSTDGKGPSYQCANAKSSSECDGNRVHQDAVLENVIPAIIEHYQSDDIREALEAGILESLAPAGVSRTTVKASLDEKSALLKHAKRNLAFCETKVQFDSIGETISELEREVARLTKAAVSASTPIETYKRQASDLVDSAMKAYDELHESWHKGDSDRLRTVIKQIITEIEVKSVRRKSPDFELWESLPEGRFRVSDLMDDPKDKAARRRMRCRVDSLWKKGAIKQIKKGQGSSQSIFARTRTAPNEVYPYFRLVSGVIYLSSGNPSFMLGHDSDVTACPVTTIPFVVRVAA